MIAYEELEKALSRWKARRASGQAAVAAEVPQEVSGIPSGITGDKRAPLTSKRFRSPLLA